MTAVDFAAFVDRLAQVSGEVILPFFRTSIGSRGQIARRRVRPGHRGRPRSRIGDAAADRPDVPGPRRHRRGEYGHDRPDAEYVWVLDPIDGTKSFISGLPTWGTLIGLTHRGTPVYGMMAQPFTRERYFGDGARARLRSLAPTRADAPAGEWVTRSLRRRPCASLAEATVMTTSPALIRDDADRAAYRRVEEQARLVRYGGDCYAYCALAAGFVDLVIETGLKPHDVVALEPIIVGAGGVMTTWDGGEASGGGRIIAAGDRRVYDEARRLLLGVKISLDAAKTKIGEDPRVSGLGGGGRPSKSAAKAPASRPMAPAIKPATRMSPESTELKFGPRRIASTLAELAISAAAEYLPPRSAKPSASRGVASARLSASAQASVRGRSRPGRDRRRRPRRR